MMTNRIPTKHIFALATMLMFMICVGMFASTRMSRANDILDDQDPGQPRGLVIMNRIYADVSDIRRCELWHIIAKSKEEMNRYDNQMRLLFHRIDDNITEYESLAPTDKEMMILTEFKRNWRLFIAEHNKIMDLSWQLRKEDALGLASGEANKYFEMASQAIVDLHAINGRLFPGAEPSIRETAWGPWLMGILAGI